MLVLETELAMVVSVELVLHGRSRQVQAARVVQAPWLALQAWVAT